MARNFFLQDIKSFVWNFSCSICRSFDRCSGGNYLVWSALTPTIIITIFSSTSAITTTLSTFFICSCRFGFLTLSVVTLTGVSTLLTMSIYKTKSPRELCYIISQKILYIHCHIHCYIHCYILCYIHCYIHCYIYCYIHCYIHCSDIVSGSGISLLCNLICLKVVNANENIDIKLPHVDCNPS